MLAVSDDLAATTGDQSFGEGISARKVICYEALPHKYSLIKGYNDLAKNNPDFSEKTKEAIGLLSSMNTETDKPRTEEEYQRLGSLLADEKVREELKKINDTVRDKHDLASHIYENASAHVTLKNDELQQCVVDGDVEKLTKLMNEAKEKLNLQHLLFTAVRYGHEKVVDCLLEHGADINQSDSMGNTALIIAAQHKQYELLSHLTSSYPQALRLTARNCSGRILFDYLPNEFRNDPVKMLQTFGRLNEKDIVGPINGIIKKYTEAKIVACGINSTFFYRKLHNEGTGHIAILEEMAREKNVGYAECLGALLLIRDNIKQQSRMDTRLLNEVNKALDNLGITELEKNPDSFAKIKDDCSQRFLNFIADTDKETRLLPSNPWLKKPLDNYKEEFKVEKLVSLEEERSEATIMPTHSR